MIKMTLSSRRRIRNSSSGGLRPSTLPLGHGGGSPQYWLSYVDGEETFSVSFKPPRPGTELWTLTWKAAVLTTTLGPPPLCYWSCSTTRTSITVRYFNKKKIAANHEATLSFNPFSATTVFGRQILIDGPRTKKNIYNGSRPIILVFNEAERAN